MEKSRKVPATLSRPEGRWESWSMVGEKRRRWRRRTTAEVLRGEKEEDGGGEDRGR